jgi:O-acetyl-ADP-ribose deacetylase (regulator of RNase III)
MKIVYGDLLDLAERGRFDIVVHGCNCRHVMGAGIALQIKKRWPEVYEIDRQREHRLGTISTAYIFRNGVSFFVVNGYTQLRPGRGHQVDLIAIREVFEQVQEDFCGKRIGYPRIGAGLGGGDWTKISGIIEIALRNEDHTLVEYQP